MSLKERTQSEPTPLTIYYMSGTGNSYRVAMWMREEAEGLGSRCRVLPIERGRPAEELGSSAAEMVGLVMPTHGFTAPWLMIRFAMRMPRGKGRRAFCAATRAGLKFGRVFLPGAAVTATFLIAAILALKGYRVRGVMSFDMPSNWMTIHSGLKRESVEAINERAEPLAKDFVGGILAGRRRWLTLNNLYEFLWAILVWWISVLYLLIGRFALAKAFFANNKCNGCGLCAGSCPAGAIRMVRAAGKTMPFWRYNCESCMRCMAFCPEMAIEASQPWLAYLTLLMFLPASHYLLTWLTAFLPWAEAIKHTWLAGLLDLAYIYLAIFLSYYPFAWLLRLRPVNSIMTFTTLTHYYRRHREPKTMLCDLLAGSEGKPADGNGDPRER